MNTQATTNTVLGKHGADCDVFKNKHGDIESVPVETPIASGADAGVQQLVDEDRSVKFSQRQLGILKAKFEAGKLPIFASSPEKKRKGLGLSKLGKGKNGVIIEEQEPEVESPKRETRIVVYKGGKASSPKIHQPETQMVVYTGGNELSASSSVSKKRQAETQIIVYMGGNATSASSKKRKAEDQIVLYTGGNAASAASSKKRKAETQIVVYTGGNRLDKCYKIWLFYYSTQRYERINSNLRLMNPATDFQVFKIEEAMKKLPCFQGLVFRGCDDLPDEIVIHLKPKSVFQDLAFLSTSKIRKKAIGDEYLFIIESKTGVDISQYSKHRQEQEVLFPPGTRFGIKKLTTARHPELERKIVVVKMEEIEESNAGNYKEGKADSTWPQCWDAERQIWLTLPLSDDDVFG